MEATSREISRVFPTPSAPLHGNPVPFPSNPHHPWAARWIHPPDDPAVPLWAFRLAVEIEKTLETTVYLSADERFQLFVDGKRVARGPERGCPSHWYYDAYQLRLPAGRHSIVALVSTLARQAPCAQMSVAKGWLFAPTDPPAHECLGTGKADWQVAPVPGIELVHRLNGGNFLGGQYAFDGRHFPWGIEAGASAEGTWRTPHTGCPARSDNNPWQFHDRPFLRPAPLPAQRSRPWGKGQVLCVTDEGPAPDRRGARTVDPVKDLPHEHERWQDLLRGKSEVSLSAGTRRRVVVDLEDYLCAYTHITVSGGEGGSWRVHWAEALFQSLERTGLRDRQMKGQRDAWKGKWFQGEGPEGRTDGSRDRTFPALWWDAGRFLELTFEAGGTDLVVTSLVFEETRYPFAPDSAFTCDDTRWTALEPILLRCLQMCMHETYMDCPYYEQLMYLGDTRLQVLASFVLTEDARLPKKSIELFDASRLASGWTQSRFPSAFRQFIPGFSWWWVGMVQDFSTWRDDPAFVQACLPGVRAVVDATLREVNAKSLLEVPPGWVFQDWVQDTSWYAGIPPGADHEPNAGLHWQAVLMLTDAARLEAAHGEPEFAQRCQRHARTLAEAGIEAFWREERGLLADTHDGTSFSAHPQCLALLSGLLPADRATSCLDRLFEEDVLQPTIYFSFYLLEALRTYGRAEALHQQLEYWFTLPGQGFKAAPETPEPARSDCHAWGSHPLFHARASLCGIRPAAPGFQKVSITPLPGPRRELRARVPHPRGHIDFAWQATEDGTSIARITLPEATPGTLVWQGHTYPLAPGFQEIKLRPTGNR